MFNKMIVSECTESWEPPSGWTGPGPVAYRSFDNLDCLAQMEHRDPASWPLTSGQVL